MTGKTMAKGMSRGALTNLGLLYCLLHSLLDMRFMQMVAPVFAGFFNIRQQWKPSPDQLPWPHVYFCLRHAAEIPRHTLSRSCRCSVSPFELRCKLRHDGQRQRHNPSGPCRHARLKSRHQNSNTAPANLNIQNRRSPQPYKSFTTRSQGGARCCKIASIPARESTTGI